VVILHAHGRILRRQASVNHVIGYLVSDNLHRILIIHKHQQRHKIAPKDC
jgi:hypothetical protein